MAVESEADRQAFVADFGETVTWTVSGTDYGITALVDRPTRRIGAEEGPDVLDYGATLLVADEDLPDGAARGNAVALRGLSHTVKAIEPDGTGMTVVRLEEVVS